MDVCFYGWAHAHFIQRQLSIYTLFIIYLLTFIIKRSLYIQISYIFMKEERQSLITNRVTGNSEIKIPQRLKIGKDLLAVLCIISVILVVMVISAFSKSDQTVVPVQVKLPWFSDQPILMEIGTSRVLEPLLYSGYDLRNLNNFKSVTEREVQWSVEPQGVVSVDMYGRINTIKQGECFLTVRSKANSQAFDLREIKVVSKRSDIDTVPQRVIKFLKGAAPPVFNLQKIVERFTKEQVKIRQDIPQSVKDASENPIGPFERMIKDNQITWQIKDYANGELRRYILRTNQSLPDTSRDKYQYFIGDRYIPDLGLYPVMIQNDGNRGIWVVGQSGNVTHIKMIKMSYSQKSEQMNAETEKNVKRHGLASGARWDGQKWVPQISDNDGLWTSMYGAGQLFRYSVLKQKGVDQISIAAARLSALNSLKAVLLTANVAGRQGKIQAKIRHLNNTRLGDGVKYSHKYLLQGKPDLRDTYVGRPIDGISFFGLDAGSNQSGNAQGGTYRFSMLPLREQDWNQSGTPATTERNLDGFMSRTFVIPAVDPQFGGGLFFKRSTNQTHTVVSGAKTLYDYTNDDHPELKLGNKPIPEVLKSILNVKGVQYNASDLIYKGDTSTDQVIGHLFIYKIAYDILNDNDNQQRQLKELIRQTLRNFCQHLINNGYRMVDATGQATKWTKLYRQFLMSDYTIEDGTLKAIQLLLSFKLTYYVTGQRKWKDQYDLLTKDQKFRYIDFVGMLWDRWVWAFTKCNDLPSQMVSLDYKQNPSQKQIERHAVYQIHYSDEEEAYLAYYLAMQLEENEEMREKYRKGMNGYWHSISQSQNPLWYYIYQLGYPDKPQNDSFGNDLRQTAAWQLSRHMVDTHQYQAYIKGSRPDVIHQGPISVNPFKVVGKRISLNDTVYVNTTINYQIYPRFDPKNIYEIKPLPADERSIHKFNGATFQNIDQNHNSDTMQPSTTFTLPYWLGVYHGLIEYD